jgi:hypothetical protein
MPRVYVRGKEASTKKWQGCDRPLGKIAPLPISTVPEPHVKMGARNHHLNQRLRFPCDNFKRSYHSSEQV